MNTTFENPVDRENHIVRGVKVLGFTSANGRIYDFAAVKEAIQKYEKAPVNKDHNMEEPSFSDRLGWLENVTLEKDGLYADFHYNPHADGIESFLWFAEHNGLGDVGFSHLVSGKYSVDPDGTERITRIDKVKSVDLVANPATTKTIFESESYGDPSEEYVSSKTKSARQQLDKISNDHKKLQQQLRNVSNEKDISVVKKKIEDITGPMNRSLRAWQDSVAQDVAHDSSEKQKIQKSKDIEMKKRFGLSESDDKPMPKKVVKESEWFSKGHPFRTKVTRSDLKKLDDEHMRLHKKTEYTVFKTPAEHRDARAEEDIASEMYEEALKLYKAQQNKGSESMKEADSDAESELIKKEYKNYQTKSLKDLRDIIKNSERIIDVSGFTSKDQAITHILRRRHGNKMIAKAFNLTEADSVFSDKLLDMIKKIAQSSASPEHKKSAIDALIKKYGSEKGSESMKEDDYDDLGLTDKEKADNLRAAKLQDRKMAASRRKNSGDDDGRRGYGPTGTTRTNRARRRESVKEAIDQNDVSKLDKIYTDLDKAAQSLNGKPGYNAAYAKATRAFQAWQKASKLLANQEEYKYHDSKNKSEQGDNEMDKEKMMEDENPMQQEEAEQDPMMDEADDVYSKIKEVCEGEGSDEEKSKQVLEMLGLSGGMSEAEDDEEMKEDDDEETKEQDSEVLENDDEEMKEEDDDEMKEDDDEDPRKESKSELKSLRKWKSEKLKQEKIVNLIKESNLEPTKVFVKQLSAIDSKLWAEAIRDRRKVALTRSAVKPISSGSQSRSELSYKQFLESVLGK